MRDVDREFEDILWECVVQEEFLGAIGVAVGRRKVAVECGVLMFNKLAVETDRCVQASVRIVSLCS